MICNTLAHLTCLGRIIWKILCSRLQVLDGEVVGFLATGAYEVEFQVLVELIYQWHSAEQFAQREIGISTEEHGLAIHLFLLIRISPCQGWNIQALQGLVGIVDQHVHGLIYLIGRIGGRRPFGEVTRATRRIAKIRRVENIRTLPLQKLIYLIPVANVLIHIGCHGFHLVGGVVRIIGSKDGLWLLCQEISVITGSHPEGRSSQSQKQYIICFHHKCFLV